MFKLTNSPSALPALEIRNASPELDSYIRFIMESDSINEPFSKVKADARPLFHPALNHFEGLILIEFWKGRINAQKFIDFLNSNAPVKS